MDFINKATGGQNKTDASSGVGGQKQDPVDKGFDSATKKAGYDMPSSVDEKITDTGRSVLEKATGKDVPDKVSN